MGVGVGIIAGLAFLVSLFLFIAMMSALKAVQSNIEKDFSSMKLKNVKTSKTWHRHEFSCLYARLKDIFEDGAFAKFEQVDGIH